MECLVKRIRREQQKEVEDLKFITVQVESQESVEMNLVRGTRQGVRLLKFKIIIRLLRV